MLTSGAWNILCVNLLHMVKWGKPRAEALQQEENHKQLVSCLIKTYATISIYICKCFLRSAEWHRDGDLTGLAWSCNRPPAASALCGHRATTPVWLFAFQRYKHAASDLSLSHRCQGVTDSSAESSQTFSHQPSGQRHLTQPSLFMKTQRFLKIRINSDTLYLMQINESRTGCLGSIFGIGHDSIS